MHTATQPYPTRWIQCRQRLGPTGKHLVVEVGPSHLFSLSLLPMMMLSHETETEEHEAKLVATAIGDNARECGKHVPANIMKVSY